VTTNLRSRHSIKWRTLPSPRRRLEVEDFDNALAGYEPSLPLDVEVEVLEMPKPKYTRIVRLQVTSRERAKFESSPIDIYADIEN
jgi:hypothetical protein